MIEVPFDVNKESNRTVFLRDGLFTALERLSEEEKPLWGRMTSHQMVEHLVWAMEVSNGLVKVECKLPLKLVERFKSFLYDDTPTSREFMNPELRKGLPPLRFAAIASAVATLQQQTVIFLAGGQEVQPRVHPVFGPLNREEWSRAHFKHYYHHLQQFGLISPVRS
jgi:oxepin-CoA hydrolase / 3-oxo-5,6-dehydrosuberyl-CoA semialdehyde dehydrogenase